MKKTKLKEFNKLYRQSGLNKNVVNFLIGSIFFIKTLS